MTNLRDLLVDFADEVRDVVVATKTREEFESETDRLIDELIEDINRRLIG